MDKGNLTESEVAAMNPAEFRSLVRGGQWTKSCETTCIGYWKANLVIVPRDYAFEFLLFSQRNPQPCAVAEATEPGNPHPIMLADDADLRTDLPRYRVFKDGKIIDEPTDIIKYWRDDLVAFLIGAIPNVIPALQNADVRYRLIGVYTSSKPCIPAGRFHGNMTVSCMIFKTSHDAIRAVQITSRHPNGHGAPVHIGDPAGIGIKDLAQPDIAPLIGDKILQHPSMLSEGFSVQPGEVPMFWGNGVTPQKVALASRVPFMITHWPAHLFVSDRLVEELAIL